MVDIREIVNRSREIENLLYSVKNNKIEKKGVLIVSEDSFRFAIERLNNLGYETRGMNVANIENYLIEFLNRVNNNFSFEKLIDEVKDNYNKIYTLNTNIKENKVLINGNMVKGNDIWVKIIRKLESLGYETKNLNINNIESYLEKCINDFDGKINTDRINTDIITLETFLNQKKFQKSCLDAKNMVEELSQLKKEKIGPFLLSDNVINSIIENNLEQISSSGYFTDDSFEKIKKQVNNILNCQDKGGYDKIKGVIDYFKKIDNTFFVPKNSNVIKITHLEDRLDLLLNLNIDDLYLSDKEINVLISSKLDQIKNDMNVEAFNSIKQTIDLIKCGSENSHEQLKEIIEYFNKIKISTDDLCQRERKISEIDTLTDQDIQKIKDSNLKKDLEYKVSAGNSSLSKLIDSARKNSEYDYQLLVGVDVRVLDTEISNLEDQIEKKQNELNKQQKLEKDINELKDLKNYIRLFKNESEKNRKDINERSLYHNDLKEMLSKKSKYLLSSSQNDAKQRIIDLESKISDVDQIGSALLGTENLSELSSEDLIKVTNYYSKEIKKIYFDMIKSYLTNQIKIPVIISIYDQKNIGNDMIDQISKLEKQVTDFEQFFDLMISQENERGSILYTENNEFNVIQRNSIKNSIIKSQQYDKKIKKIQTQTVNSRNFIFKYINDQRINGYNKKKEKLNLHRQSIAKSVVQKSINTQLKQLPLSNIYLSKKFNIEKENINEIRKVLKDQNLNIQSLLYKDASAGIEINEEIGRTL